MPNLTVTIEDNSPLLKYDTTWVIGSSADSLLNLYLETNFMGTTKGGAQMTFHYNGTDVAVYGAKRGNHGRYQVAIDNTTFNAVSGNAPDPRIFQTLLFQSSGLEQGAHTLSVTNVDDTKWFDVDFITWNVIWGDPTAKLAITSIDDTDGGWTWSGNDWNTSPPLAGRWFGGTGHITTIFGATAQISFIVSIRHTTRAIVLNPPGYARIQSCQWPLLKDCPGEAISLYGPVNSTGAPYTIKFDNGAPASYDSSGRSQSFQTMLFHANNLGPGGHTLTFTCQANAHQACGVDYVQVYSAAGNPASFTSSTAASTTSRLSAGDIVGITLGSLSILCALGVLALYLTLRRRSERYTSLEPTTFTGSQSVTQSMYSQ